MNPPSRLPTGELQLVDRDGNVYTAYNTSPTESLDNSPWFEPPPNRKARRKAAAIARKKRKRK